MTDTELKPKRRAQKSVTPEEEALQILAESGLESEEKVEETPAKKPRASRKKSEEPESGAVAAETEKPKRTRAKKAEAAPEPEAAEVTAVVEEPVQMAEAVAEMAEAVEEMAEAVEHLGQAAFDESEDEPAEEVPAAPAVARRKERDSDSDTPTFSDLGLSDAILKSVKDVGYEEPTPIQAITIPAMLRGGDIIAQAQTGSGKTAAFGFPIIDSVDGRDRSVQALILTPTRELAIQVAEALQQYGKHKGLETLPTTVPRMAARSAARGRHTRPRDGPYAPWHAGARRSRILRARRSR